MTAQRSYKSKKINHQLLAKRFENAKVYAKVLQPSTIGSLLVILKKWIRFCIDAGICMDEDPSIEMLKKTLLDQSVSVSKKELQFIEALVNAKSGQIQHFLLWLCYDSIGIDSAQDIPLSGDDEDPLYFEDFRDDEDTVSEDYPLETTRRGSPMTRLTTLRNYWLNMGMIYTRWSVYMHNRLDRIPHEISISANNYMKNVLQKQFQLSKAPKERPVLTKDDNAALLFHSMVECAQVLPSEYLRIVLRTISIIQTATAARPGTLVESNCYRQTNEALKYKDMYFYLARQEDGSEMLCLEMVLRLYKGSRDKMKSEATTFAHYSSNMLYNCVMVHILAIAFADGAFKYLKTPWDFMRATVPVERNGHPFQWKEEFLERPVFREPVVLDSLHYEISPTRALTYARYAQLLAVTANDFGFEQRVTPYCIRRGNINATIQSGAPMPIVKQIMGHKSAVTVQNHYLSKYVVIDGHAEYWGRKQDLTAAKIIGSMSLHVDTRRPKSCSREEKEEYYAKDKILQEINRQRKQIGESLKIQYGAIKKADPMSAQFQKLKALESRVKSRKEQLAKQALKDKKERFERTVHEKDFLGLWEKDAYVSPLAGQKRRYALDLRGELVRMMYPGLEFHTSRRSANPMAGFDVEPVLERTPEWCAAVATMAEYCSLSEFKGHGIATEEGGYKQCLFCVEDYRMVESRRCRVFANPRNLRHHVDLFHIKRWDFKQNPLPCPNADCAERSLAFCTVDEFKNHVQRWHGIRL